MIFDVRLIINFLALGLITLAFGLKEDKGWKIVVGSAITAASIILNTIAVFNGG